MFDEAARRAEVARRADAAHEFRAGWRLLIPTTLGVALGFPTLAIFTLGIFAPELARDFHWSYSQIMAGTMIVTLASFVAGPFVGSLSDRVGVQRVAIISTVLLGLSFMGFALSTGSLPQYYATWLLMSFLGAGTAQVVWTRTIHQHFDAGRGLAIGITLAGVGIFTLLGKPLASLIVTHAGWRMAYAVIGLLPLLLVVPASLWGLKARPGTQVANSTAAVVAAQGLTFRQAIRTRHFWLFVAAFPLLAIALTGIISNVEIILLSHHFSKAMVLTIVPWMGLTIAAGRLFGGFLADLLWAPLIASILLCVAAGVCFMLAQSEIGYWTAVVAMLLVGTTIGVEIDLTSYLVARYLGVKHYGQLYGILYSFIAFGGGLGPSCFGWAYDRWGSYSLVLRMAGGGLVLSAALLLLLGPYTNFKATQCDGSSDAH